MKQVPTGKYEWRSLYLAALFERDRKQLQERIAEAQSAMTQRGHELLQTSGDTYEIRALDAALAALQALRKASYLSRWPSH